MTIQHDLHTVHLLKGVATQQNVVFKDSSEQVDTYLHSTTECLTYEQDPKDRAALVYNLTMSLTAAYKCTHAVSSARLSSSRWYLYSTLFQILTYQA